MSWPSVASMLAVALYHLADAFWVARLSHEALAAITICYPVQAMILSIGIGTGVGAGSFASRLFGAMETKKARQVAGQTILISLLISFVLIFLVNYYAHSIVSLFGATNEIILPAAQYLKILVWGTPAIFIIFITNNLLRADGRPLLSMLILLSLAVLAALFTPLLIFPWWIFPGLGLPGAALGAVLAQIMVGGAALALLFQRNSPFRPAFQDFYLKPDIVLATYATGFPSIIMNLVMSFMLIIINNVLSIYGPSAQAIMGLCFRINSLVTMVIFALGHGVLPMVGYNAGANQWDRVGQTVRGATLIAFAFAFISSSLIVLFAQPLVSLFLAESLVREGATALKIYATMLIFAAPVLIWINALIALGRGFAAMFFLITRDLLFITPLLFFLPEALGATKVWLSQPLGNAALFTIMLCWLLRFSDTRSLLVGKKLA